VLKSGIAVTSNHRPKQYMPILPCWVAAIMQHELNCTGRTFPIFIQSGSVFHQ